MIYRSTNLFMNLDLWVIGKYPENTVVTFDCCDNERGCPLSIQSVDVCSTINQQLGNFIFITGRRQVRYPNVVKLQTSLVPNRPILGYSIILSHIT